MSSNAVPILARRVRRLATIIAEVPEVVADVRRRITEAVTAAEPGNRSGGRPE
jgi:hypothetical protein